MVAGRVHKYSGSWENNVLPKRRSSQAAALLVHATEGAACLIKVPAVLSWGAYPATRFLGAKNRSSTAHLIWKLHRGVCLSDFEGRHSSPGDTQYKPTGRAV